MNISVSECCIHSALTGLESPRRYTAAEMPLSGSVVMYDGNPLSPGYKAGGNRSHDPASPRFPDTLCILIGSLLSFRSSPKRWLRLDDPNRKCDTREGSARFLKSLRPLEPHKPSEGATQKYQTIMCGSAINGSSAGYIYLQFPCARDTSKVEYTNNINIKYNYREVYCKTTC